MGLISIIVFEKSKFEKDQNLKGRKLKIYVTYGVVVDEVHETISFRQREFLKKMTHFDTQKKRLKKIPKETSTKY